MNIVIVIFLDFTHINHSLSQGAVGDCSVGGGVHLKALHRSGGGGDTLHRQSVVWLENAKKSSNRARRLAAAPHAARHTDQTLIQHWPHGRCSAELRFDNQPTTRCRVMRAFVLRGGNGPEQWHRKVGETWSTTLLWCSLLVVGDVDAHWVLCVCE